MESAPREVGSARADLVARGAARRQGDARVGAASAATGWMRTTRTATPATTWSTCAPRCPCAQRFRALRPRDQRCSTRATPSSPATPRRAARSSRRGWRGRSTLGSSTAGSRRRRRDDAPHTLLTRALAATAAAALLVARRLRPRGPGARRPRSRSRTPVRATRPSRWTRAPAPRTSAWVGAPVGQRGRLPRAIERGEAGAPVRGQRHPRRRRAARAGAGAGRLRAQRRRATCSGRTTRRSRAAASPRATCASPARPTAGGRRAGGDGQRRRGRAPVVAHASTTFAVAPDGTVYVSWIDSRERDRVRAELGIGDEAGGHGGHGATAAHEAGRGRAGDPVVGRARRALDGRRAHVEPGVVVARATSAPAAARRSPSRRTATRCYVAWRHVSRRGTCATWWSPARPTAADVHPARRACTTTAG